MHNSLAIVFVTNADDGIISRYSIDLEKGRLSFLGTTESKPNITALALNNNGQAIPKQLYTSTRAEPYQLLSYKITNKGELEHLATTSLPEGMCYLSTDKTNHFLFAASYHGNMISVSSINADGAVTTPAMAIYPTDPKAHSVVIHPNNRFVYVGNLGGDKILQFSLDEKGKLTPIGKGYLDIIQGSGPRHVLIAPNGQFAYMVNEYDATICCFSIDMQTGQLAYLVTNDEFPAKEYDLINTQLVDASLHPKQSPIWAADIKITANGQFVYVSERTSSTVSLYHVDAKTGHLHYQNSITVEKQPRSIAISPDGCYLVASGQLANNIGLYRIDQVTGALTKCDEANTGKNSYWVEIVSLSL